LIYTTDESVNGVATCAGAAPVVGRPAAAA